MNTATTTEPNNEVETETNGNAPEENVEVESTIRVYQRALYNSICDAGAAEGMLRKSTVLLGDFYNRWFATNDVQEFLDDAQCDYPIMQSYVEHLIDSTNDALALITQAAERKAIRI